MKLKELEKKQLLLKQKLGKKQRQFEMMMDMKPQRVKEVIIKNKELELREKTDLHKRKEKVIKERANKATRRFQIDEGDENVLARSIMLEDGQMSPVKNRFLRSPAKKDLKAKSRFTRDPEPGKNDPIRTLAFVEKFESMSGDEEEDDYEKKFDELKIQYAEKFGPRLPDPSRIRWLQDTRKRLNEFYTKISEERGKQLNEKLKSTILAKEGKSVDQDYDDLSRKYVRRYQEFQKDQMRQEMKREERNNLFEDVKKYSYISLSNLFIKKMCQNLKLQNFSPMKL